MIVLRDRENIVPNFVILLSSVVLLGLLIVLVAVPKPSTRGMELKRKNREFEVRLQTKTAQERLQAARTAVATQTWTGSEQVVAPQALAKVTSLVRARGLTLIAFRPQRRQEDGPLPMLPFLLTVDGGYPGVVALVRDLENPANKLAVSLVQVASADAASDRVTASIGLVAYIATPNATKAEVPTRG